MFSAVVLLLVSLTVAVAIAAVAAYSRRGANTDSVVGQQLSQVGRHLNGEAEAPEALTRLMTKQS